MAQTQSFSIPMANMNLAPSEALNQIMDNLNHLNIIVNQAVNTIHSRIKEESLLLSSISKRVDAAFQKTQLIAQNPNKSTTIYSSPNYPVNEDKKVSINQPLINKMDINHNNPSKPVRSNYNLSLRQRNEKPANVETVSLLKTIKDKTSNIADINNTKSKPAPVHNEAIPEWVSSVADCMVFGTNRNAYNKRHKSGLNSGSAMFDDKRKRKSSMDRKRIKDKDKRDLGPQPSSINDPFYNLKLQQKTFGDRIRYLPDSSRKNMPKFKAPTNLDHMTYHGVVASDIIYQQQQQGHYDEQDAFMIPSEVLNARYGDIDDNVSFDYGDDVQPPSVTDNNKHVAAKRDTVADNKGAEKGKVAESVNTKQVHHYPTPTDEPIPDEEEEKRAEVLKTEQPFIPDVKPQNDSLQNKKVESDKGGFDAKALIKGKEALKRGKEEEEHKEEGKKDDDIKPSSGLRFDANALQRARDRLKKNASSGDNNGDNNGDRSKRDSENENTEEPKGAKGIKKTIFDAMKVIRKFHVDTDSENEEDDEVFSD